MTMLGMLARGGGVPPRSAEAPLAFGFFGRFPLHRTTGLIHRQAVGVAAASEMYAPVYTYCTASLTLA